MSIPVRCFSCNKVLGGLWDRYQRGEDFNSLGLKRYCCKRMLLCSTDVYSKILEYDTLPSSVKEKTEFAENRVYKSD